MLPQLPQADFLAIKPDVTLDLWATDFRYNQIPEGFGCYAFFSRKTGEIVYVGSACAHSPDASQSGLRMRMRFYRDRGNTGRHKTWRVREENEQNPLLLSLWLVANQGDCRKYEDDAIRLHKPRLNIIGKSETTLGEYRERKRAAARKTMMRNRQHLFDPDLVRTCTVCKLPKPCKEFRRNRNKKFGVQAYCKICERLP